MLETRISIALAFANSLYSLDMEAPPCRASVNSPHFFLTVVYTCILAVFYKNGDQVHDVDGGESNNGHARLPVPAHFHKIILYARPGGLIETTALFLPNVDSSLRSNQADSSLISKLVRADDIVELTGIDYPTGLRSTDGGDAKDKAIEGFKATALWPTEQPKFRED